MLLTIHAPRAKAPSLVLLTLPRTAKGEGQIENERGWDDGGGDGWRGGNGGSSSSSWGNGVGAAAEMVTAVIGLINQARENPVPVAVPKAAAAEPKDAVEGPKEPDVVPKAVVAEPKVEAKPAAEAAQPKAIAELKPAPKDVPAKVSAGPKDVPMSSKPQAHNFCKCDSVLQLLEQNSIFIFLTIALIVS